MALLHEAGQRPAAQDLEIVRVGADGENSHHGLRQGDVEEALLDRPEREPGRPERNRLVPEGRENDARRNGHERGDAALERLEQFLAGPRDAAADDHGRRIRGP